ncbi:uncharacterized protein LOC109085208 isoform X2 [Cyprinus carpio]|uniref:Uncharacterized protein LOC109085208 isoform X2 n=1 Tax=Cyprinus carpio TaxID=7962 RepID=A0A9R0APN0_CYPCA|nr:uncharacterized protein LOC109085208 isoform X2 [Cyprinus carpio]
MSCERRVEPRQHGEEPGAGQRQDTQHVRGDSQQTMDDQGQSDEEEKGSPLNAGIEVMVLQHVNEAEMEKEKNKETEEEAGHSQSKTYRWNPARKVCNISSSSAFKLSKPRWRLDCKLGYFDLIGCDFLIEEDFKVWLLKMNCYPALHANCEVLKDVIHLTLLWKF